MSYFRQVDNGAGGPCSRIVAIMDNSVWGIPVLSFVFAGAGAYLGSYLKKKGENLAIKEDFRELKSQTADLRKATKEIEVKIDNQVWSGQRQWELKRDALLATTSALRYAQNAFSNLYSAYDEGMRIKDDQYRKERRLEEIKQCSQALAAFNEKRFQATLVCSGKVTSALSRASSLMRLCMKDTAQEDFMKASSVIPRIGDAVDSAIDVMRNELGFMPRSNESWAAPSPGPQGPAIDKP
jgi:hypothetical protein